MNHQPERVSVRFVTSRQAVDVWEEPRANARGLMELMELRWR